MAAMIIRSQDGTSRTVPLTGKPITLGRADSCDVVLRHGEVSRTHAQIWVDDQGRILVSDRSKNGTRVDDGDAFQNDTRSAMRLIRIGDYDIELVRLPNERVLHESEVRFTPDNETTINNTHYFSSSRQIDLNEQRLALLISLTERIGGTFERKQLLEQALDACCETLGFERGLIALKTTRGEPDLPLTRNIQKDETGAYKVSRTLINRALVDGQQAVVNDPATDLVDNLSESLVRFPIRSALCVPIVNRSEILGVIYGDRITRAQTYTREDVDFLAAIAQQVGVGLANLRLFQEHLRSQRIYLELQQARAIQRDLLPADPLSCGCVTLAGFNEPSSAVGGDYFDYFPLTDNTVAFTIADVTGHGLPAALVMANLQAALRVAITAEIPLSDLAARLNRLVYENTGSSVFITGIFGRINTETGLVEYTNAGHPAPVLLREGNVEEHDHEGAALPLGIELGEEYSVRTIQPDGINAVLFYTDGLIEAEGPDGAMLNLEPVLSALAGDTDRSAQSIMDVSLKLVRKHVDTGKVGDDLTLLGLQIHAG